jgi:zinc protease
MKSMSRAAAEPAPDVLPIREAVLDNGLKVLVCEVHAAPLVSVWCWYKVGSKDEPQGRTGASHWVEHMTFKGTRNIPRDEMKGYIERLGGAWNGYTWIDQTAYVETATTDALDAMLFVEAERMEGCLFDPDDVESERTVIISELQGGENDPEELLDNEVTATAYKVHPYRHPTIGWIADLRSMRRDDLYEHYRRFYVPGNATLVVAGDVETDAALKRIEAHFGRIADAAPPPRVTVVEPPQIAERRVRLRRPGTTAYWRAVFHAPAATDADFLPLLFVDAILNGASGLNIWNGHGVPVPQRGSRLYRALVDRGLASSVSGALLATEHPYLYTMAATVAEGQTIQTVEAVLLEELSRLAAGGVTDDECRRARAQLRARFVYENDGVTDIAHQLGYFETLAGWRLYQDLRARLGEVTPADVGSAAARYLTADARTIGWVEPAGTVP